MEEVEADVFKDQPPPD